MKRLFSALAAAALAATILVPAAGAAPLSKAILWRNDSLSVTCGLEIHALSKPASEVLCAARGIPAPKHGVGDSGFVQLGLLGQPKVLRLSQNSFVAGTTTVKLGRGRLWNQLGVTCHVAQTTVMCFNGDNHGFVIGDRHYRSF